MATKATAERRPVLATRGLTVSYGGVKANDSIDLEVYAGEVVGLIGPNGAGKTTFIDAVSGFTDCTGEVWVGDRRVDSMPPYRRRRHGLARSWQSGELFADLTAGENLQVVRHRVGIRSMLVDLVRRGGSKLDEEVYSTLCAVGLDHAADRLPEELSLGEQKLVGVARALTGGSQMLLLDEPAAGLDTNEGRDLGRRLRRIADTGVGCLLVDHDMGLVLELCDRIYVLDFGRLICVGTAAEVTADKGVVAAYLGSPDLDGDRVSG